MIFVDTGAWFALYIVADPDHPRAEAWFQKVPDRLLTTDYVLDELFTLLKVRGHAEIAFALGADMLSGLACEVEYVLPTDVQDAWEVFSTYRDKGWSFTDCTSRVVMKRLGISKAAASDEHFRQFGNVTVER